MHAIYLVHACACPTHRTFDPDEADFFYVPVYIACMLWPVLGWADHPFFYAPVSVDLMLVVVMGGMVSCGHK